MHLRARRGPRRLPPHRCPPRGAGTLSGDCDYEAVVVGSGFGGSIAALRLSEAERSVLVLERGRRYHPGEFPRDVRDTDSLLWRYPRRRRSLGPYELRFFSGLAAVAASGVGGGSLIYANVHIRPPASLFENPRWPAGLTLAGLSPHYDAVARELDIAPVPTEVKLPKRDAFRKAARQLGRSAFDPDLAVSWTQPRALAGGKCQLVSECEFGCQHGAKHTLDRTYLARAERRGAEVRPGAIATHVEPADGGYRVHWRDVARGSAGTVTGRRIVLSAGTLGTNELLLRSRDVARTLPRLSPRLGFGYSANGDFLGSVENAGVDLQPWLGPDVTSVIPFFDGLPGFSMAAPTFSRPVMAVLTSLGQTSGRLSRRLSRVLWPLFGACLPLALRLGLLSRPVPLPGKPPRDPDRTTFLFAIGQDNGGGRIRLRRGRLDIKWRYAAENADLVDRMTEAMARMGAEYGGSFAPLFTWLLFRRIVTVHSLGGCNLSESPETGVVSPAGEVHGYPGLFVADGSVIPTAVGFHPAMTIAAVSELIAERVAASL